MAQLVVKLNFDEQTSENFQKVMNVLDGLDIESVTWQDSAQGTVFQTRVQSGATGSDLSAAVSKAVDQVKAKRD